MTEEIVSTAKELTEDFLTQLGLDADISVEMSDKDEERGIQYIQVDLEGDNLNELIGHHGRNLESMQIILGLMLVKTLKTDENLRVLLEINDYKESREKYLRSYALRAADQVRESGQDMELQPMKPAERRVVHMVLKQEEGIMSESTGEGDDRRIVVKAADADPII